VWGHIASPSGPVGPLRFQGSGGLFSHSAQDSIPLRPKQGDLDRVPRPRNPAPRRPASWCRSTLLHGPSSRSLDWTPALHVGRLPAHQLGRLNVQQPLALALTANEPGGRPFQQQPPQRRRFQPTLQCPRRRHQVAVRGRRRRPMPPRRAIRRPNSPGQKAARPSPAAITGCMAGMLSPKR